MHLHLRHWLLCLACNFAISLPASAALAGEVRLALPGIDNSEILRMRDSGKNWREFQVDRSQLWVANSATALKVQSTEGAPARAAIGNGAAGPSAPVTLAGYPGYAAYGLLAALVLLLVLLVKIHGLRRRVAQHTAELAAAMRAADQ